MAIDFHFHSVANTDNTLLVGKLVTVASIGIFAGTSFSYNTIIMPALRKFSSSSSVAIWSEAVNASKGQVAAVVLGSLGSAGLYYQTKNPAYLYSAVSLALNVPYTALLILPINKKLFDIRHNNTVNGKTNSLKDGKTEDSEADDLLRRWNLFHAGRTVLGLAALFATVYGLASDRAIRFVVFK
ncbi:hypothetical protein B0O80DRAFT_435961 [Mortierella sp. GBAus27b]|nr:hypothetical protein BGX31_000387 [Mortierella sp. GBA43]KAI8362468.1 hypothetical protein B0O80DRAFT_435961 [Mortierella sp. GBAus27b]